MLIVGFSLDGISNQEQTRWLSWNVDGGVRGIDLARKPSLSNTAEYGAGEFPLPIKPLAGTGTHFTSKASSMIRSQQTEESYPDLSNLKRELERSKKEQDKANLDRDQAILDRGQVKPERDQTILERDQAILYRDVLRVERPQNRNCQKAWRIATR